MTQENKELLLKDLCARLPYGVKVCSPDKTICSIWNVPTISAVTVINGSGQSSHPIKDIKPYLRPMSSMTKEEFSTINVRSCLMPIDNDVRIVNYGQLDFLNSHHFDYRGLIEKGLAIKAPEGMYKTE